MTTRPLRHADDRAQELANLREWRDRMAADLAWVVGLIAHVERGGESDVTGVHRPQSLSCRLNSQKGATDERPAQEATTGSCGNDDDVLILAAGDGMPATGPARSNSAGPSISREDRG